MPAWRALSIWKPPISGRWTSYLWMFLKPTLCRRVLEHEKPHQHPHNNTPRHQVDQPHGPEVLREGRVEPPDGNARTKEAPEVHRNGRRQRPRHRLSVVKGEPPMDVVGQNPRQSPTETPEQANVFVGKDDQECRPEKEKQCAVETASDAESHN